MFSGSLLMGIIKERHTLFLPWLKYSGILLALGTVLLLYSCILQIVVYPKHFYKQLASLCLYIVILSFGTYIKCVIHSLYKEVKKSSNQNVPLNPVTVEAPISNPETRQHGDYQQF
ncbi:uncharacterized protein LOC117785251 [Drosophila innubila]|uniref:uncharacterized protein LOC117785251 n=1 Tax=Drosophila innubila TaxID=198719 RepID=UPI00148CE61F|nr:uncharacterized protein LOC117785251 [Drosophila innubila]